MDRHDLAALFEATDQERPRVREGAGAAGALEAQAEQQLLDCRDVGPRGGVDPEVDDALAGKIGDRGGADVRDFEVRPRGPHDRVDPGGHDRRARIGRPDDQRALGVGKDRAVCHERECRGPRLPGPGLS